MDKIAAFENLLFPLSDGFTSAGMEFIGASDLTDELGSTFRIFKFLNPESQTRMDISVSRLQGSVVVHIACRDSRSFTVENYLKRKGRRDEWTQHCFRKGPETILPYLNQLLKADLYDILVGKESVEIPYDWTEFG
ncbi:MAG: hypothetical protein ACO3A4_04235 [Silvanigrellaceae bacterium]